MQNHNIQNIDLKSVKIFGYAWALILLMIWNQFKDKNFLIFLSFIFFAITLISPKIFIKIKLYDCWIKFGNFVGKINSKIIIAILFFAVFCPIGIVMKLFGKDLLNKKLDKNTTSYFIPRVNNLSNMKNQF